MFSHYNVSLRISCLLLAFLVICLGIEAKTILVGKSATSDFNRIQAAIDVAKHGDTIAVASGRYSESILIKRKNINIRGAGKDKTYLEFDGPNLVLYAESVKKTVISNMTIAYTGIGKRSTTWFFNSEVTLQNCEVIGGFYAGVYITANSKVVIHNNVVKKNQLTGLSASNSELRITANLISENGQQGILLKNCRSSVIRGNTIFRNNKGGVNIEGIEEGLQILHNTISGNRSTGISTDNQAVIENNIIVLNGIGIEINPNGKSTTVLGIGHNNVWRNSQYDYSKMRKPLTDLSVDPMFINEKLDDYGLRVRSPMIGLASDGSDLGSFQSRRRQTSEDMPPKPNSKTTSQVIVPSIRNPISDQDNNKVTQLMAPSSKMLTEASPNLADGPETVKRDVPIFLMDIVRKQPYFVEVGQIFKLKTTRKLDKIQAKPYGAKYDPKTRIFEWVPLIHQVGEATVIFTGISSHFVQLFVWKHNLPPRISYINGKVINRDFDKNGNLIPIKFNVREGKETRLEFSVEGVPAEHLKYTYISIPIGANIDGNTLTWRPSLKTVQMIRKGNQNVAEFPVLVSVSNGSEADAIDLILVVQESKSRLPTPKRK